MNRFKAISIAIAASSLGIAALPASAATSFTGSGSSSIVAGNGFFTDSAIPVGKFSDTITFTSPSAGTTTVGIMYLKVSAGISKLTATLNGVAIAINTLFGMGVGSASVSYAAGHSNTLVIKGMSNGVSATYTGSTAFAAVPEPATWALMIAGFGLAGVSLRRRRAPARTVALA